MVVWNSRFLHSPTKGVIPRTVGVGSFHRDPTGNVGNPRLTASRRRARWRRARLRLAVKRGSGLCHPQPRGASHHSAAPRAGDRTSHRPTRHAIVDANRPGVKTACRPRRKRLPAAAKRSRICNNSPQRKPGECSRAGVWLIFGRNSQPLAETIMPKNVPDPLSFQGQQRPSRERFQNRRHRVPARSAASGKRLTA